MNHPKPDISVVIPAYNNLALFREALQSARMQEDVNVHIVVTDDSVHSDIADWIGQAALPQVEYLRNSPPLGAVKNWNHGLSHATGRYTMLLHHDERLPSPRFLCDALGQLSRSGADLIISDVVVRHPGNLESRQALRPTLRRFILRHLPSLIYTANLIGPTACVIFSTACLLPFNEKLRWLVDADWYFRMLAGRKTIVSAGEPIVSVFGHPNQITLSLERNQVEKEDQAVIKADMPLPAVATALMLRNLIGFLKRKLNLKKNPLRPCANR